MSDVDRDDLLRAREAAAAIRAGQLSARTYAERCIRRIEAREAEVKAWVAFDAERALRLAAACDARRGDEDDTPLHGVPIGVKDLFATADLPTQMGSPLYAGHRTAHDAAVVSRLQRAGAYVMGKTVTAELAFMHPGVTTNPWNAAHTPGGSSSGSAAAVAAGFVPLAIGTQTNGSVIRPAAYCGIVGFKPTAGTVPGGGCFVFSPTLDQVGVFANDVADAALFAAVLMDEPSLQGAAVASARVPRLAALARFSWCETAPEAAAHFEATLQRLEAAGAIVDRIELPSALADAQAVHRCIMRYEAARELMQARAQQAELLSPVLREAVDEGAAFEVTQYRDALARRAAMAEAADDLCADYDAVLSPPAADAAPRGLQSTGDPSFATLWTLVGVPSISIPSGWSQAGLPFGLQLAVANGADAALLGIARWCEERLGEAHNEGRA